VSEYGGTGPDDEADWAEGDAWSDGAENPKSDLVELDEAEREGPPERLSGGEPLVDPAHETDGSPDAEAVEHDPLDDFADAPEAAALPDVPFEPTGDPRVDDAVGRLDELAASPTHEHVGVFEDVHRRLHEALSDVGLER
jgi:hypothetical protein